MYEVTKLHLGCGPHIFQGWRNYDLDPGIGGFRCDLREPLPFETGKADYIFTEHAIEHLTLKEGQRLLNECYRVLKPGGVIRISTPNLRSIMNDYRIKKTDRYAPTWSPETPAQFVNEGLRLWGHQFIYDLEEITIALRLAGFGPIDTREWHKSPFPFLIDLEVRPYMNDLIVEAIK